MSQRLTPPKVMVVTFPSPPHPLTFLGHVSWPEGKLFLMARYKLYQAWPLKCKDMQGSTRMQMNAFQQDRDLAMIVREEDITNTITTESKRADKIQGVNESHLV